MAFGPINSWQIDGEKMETVTDFIFLGSKITVDGNCGKEIKKQLLQPCGLCGRGRGWDDLGEWHWNMCNIIHETSRQSRFDARYWLLEAGALGRPRGMVWRGRREEGSRWGTHVYQWRIHFDIWQNQYNIVKLKNKIKFKKSRKKKRILAWIAISYSRGFFQPRDPAWASSVSCIGRRILYH